MGNDVYPYIERVKNESGQDARPRVWHMDPATHADTLQGVFLDFCCAPTVMDCYGGFSKLVTKKTFMRLRFYLCSNAQDTPLPDCRWGTLKNLAWHILSSAQAYCGHYILRDYLDVVDAVLEWLDSSPPYIPSLPSRTL